MERLGWCTRVRWSRGTRGDVRWCSIRGRGPFADAEKLAIRTAPRPTENLEPLRSVSWPAGIESST